MDIHRFFYDFHGKPTNRLANSVLPILYCVQYLEEDFPTQIRTRIQSCKTFEGTCSVSYCTIRMYVHTGSDLTGLDLT